MEVSEPFFENAFGKTVELGNKLAEQTEGEHDNTGLRDIADGLLAGAIQYWLFAQQPCGKIECEECIVTAQERLEELKRLVTEFAQENQYYHSPSDLIAGRA